MSIQNVDFNNLASFENYNYYYDYFEFRKNFNPVSKFLMLDGENKNVQTI